MVQTARRILRCWNTKHTNWWTWISSTNCYSTFSTNINRLSKGLRKPGPFGNRNQNLFFDNMCSSPKLLDNLLSQETYACLTVWLNRKELPPCSTMKLTEAREMVCQQWAKLLFTKWHDKRDISFLSTNVSTGTVMWKGRSKDRNSKTALESLYTLNMGVLIKLIIFVHPIMLADNPEYGKGTLYGSCSMQRCAMPIISRAFNKIMGGSYCFVSHSPRSLSLTSPSTSVQPCSKWGPALTSISSM